ncbi:MAG: hypothetical protein M3552_08460 [Planctomycetota bacterium]|nr:hypothetical protein [Planctomycetaceae bacterium]MDQ3330672.1 hypothetical protein [Planctomycetota bacterium]
MPAGTKTRTIRLLAAASLLTLMVGCRVPGASFASDPLQLRFAEATKQSMLAAEQAEAAPTPRPLQSAESKPIVLAGHSSL